MGMIAAVVPVILPAVITIALAVEMLRMIRRHVLLRKPSTIKTSGSMVTNWPDKITALTQNKMVVQSVYTTSHLIQVTGEGYGPDGSFQLVSESNTSVYPLYLRPSSFPVELQTLLVASIVCNDAILRQAHGEWSISGEPTEGALLALAGKAAYFQHQWTTWLPRLSKFSFSPKRERMSVLCKNKIAESFQCPLLASAPYFVFTKGSPEAVLERCSRQQEGDNTSMLTSVVRTQILTRNEQFSSRGLRVLGIAYKPIINLLDDGLIETDAERHLIWLGLVGMTEFSHTKAPMAAKGFQRLHMT